MKDKKPLKLVLRWKEHAGNFWQSIRKLYGEDANIRWHWEVVDSEGRAVVKSTLTYPTEVDAVAGALDIQKFIAEAQAYDVRKVEK